MSEQTVVKAYIMFSVRKSVVVRVRKDHVKFNFFHSELIR